MHKLRTFLTGVVSILAELMADQTGALKLKAMSEIADKWRRRAGAASADYEAGIKSPKEDWASETIAAESAYEAGVTDAIGRKAFGKGVREAGSEKWSRKALAVGPARYTQGVSISEPDYSAGFGPYRDAIERIVLPARGRRGDPANIERVRAIADALHGQKVGRAR